MACVLLPTTEWTPSCETLRGQLDVGDELLVLCDDPADPVARDPPADDAVRVVPVGDPDGCSGKSHALAVGLGEVGDDHDVLVLTDDDVERDAAWLATLTDAAREHGAVSATPVFVGDGWWRLLEPAMATFGSALLCAYGGVWGGGVAFERDRLDLDGYRRDLERTVSDDALLWDRLGEASASDGEGGTGERDASGGVYTSPDLVNRVAVPGDLGSVRERFARFALTYRYWLPRATAALWVLLVAFCLLAVVSPAAAAGVATLAAYRSYRYLGLERRTWLLAFPSAFCLLLALAAAWLRPSFAWGGRRYRWTGRFDVTVEE